jgi:hypothetical protein
MVITPDGLPVGLQTKKCAAERMFSGTFFMLGSDPRF